MRNPSSIITDAPEAVEPLEEVRVTLTAIDDADIRVMHAIPYQVVALEGGGTIFDAYGNIRDGHGSFSFMAPIAEGRTALGVRIGQGKDAVSATISIETRESWEAIHITYLPLLPDWLVDAPEGVWRAWLEENL